jgi:hypothetical protein
MEEQHNLENVNNCLNTNIYSYLETSGGQTSNLHLNVVRFFNTSVNRTSVVAKNSCFPALLSNVCPSIVSGCETFLSEEFWKLLNF